METTANRRTFYSPSYVIRYTNRDGSGYLSIDGSGSLDSAVRWTHQHSLLMLVYALQLANDVEGNPRNETFTVMLHGEILHEIWTSTSRLNRYREHIDRIKSLHANQKFFDADRPDYSNCDLVGLNKYLLLGGLETRYITAAECDLLRDRGVKAEAGWYAFRQEMGVLTQGTGPYRSYLNLLLDAQQLVEQLTADIHLHCVHTTQTASPALSIC